MINPPSLNVQMLWYLGFSDVLYELRDKYKTLEKTWLARENHSNERRPYPN